MSYKDAGSIQIVPLDATPSQTLPAVSTPVGNLPLLLLEFLPLAYIAT
jgi:hypothetical protein